MAYHIEIKKSAVKELAALPKRDQHRLITAIESLADNPRPDGVGKLTGADNLYRLRVGDYRVVYQIWDRKLVVLIIRVGQRKDIYRKF